MRHTIKILAVAAIAFCGQALAEGLMIEAPWIREAPPNAQAVGGFMVLRNESNTPRQLVEATSPAFGEVQLHRTVMEGGMAKMVRQNAIEIPAKGTQKLEPGGYHLMLMAPKKALKAGEEVEVTLTFKDGEKQTLKMPVRGGGMPAGHDHGAMQHNH